MKKKIFMILILAVIACVSGFFVWQSVFGEDDREIIERRLDEICQMMGKTGTEGFVIQLEHARTISRYFDDTCRIRLPKFYKEAEMTRDDLEKNLIKARNWTTSLELKMYDMRLQFQEGEPLRCKMLVTGMLNAKTKTGGSFREGYDLELNWIKKDGEWLIEGVGFSEILNK